MMNVAVRFDIDGNCLGPKLPTWGTPAYEGPYFVELQLQLPVGFSFARRTITEMERISAEECAKMRARTNAFYEREAARMEM